MKRRTSLSSLREMSEINMTPLMDLTFILLITFIITFPLIEQGIPIDLPSGAADELAAEDSRTISLDGEGVLYLDDERITVSALTAQMNEVGAQRPETTVFVRADQNLAYARVVDVMKILHEAHIVRTALVTQAE